MAESVKPQQDLLSLILEPLLMGARHTAGTVGGDISDIMSGKFNWDIASRLSQVLGELPIMKGLTKGAETAKGVIAPTANKRLQELFEAIRQRAPKLVSQAEGATHTVFPYLIPREAMPVGGDLLGLLRRSKTLPKSELYVRGGRPVEEQINTLAHELRHFVTGSNPALMNKPAGHALETAQQLSHMMPAPQQRGMQQYLSEIGTPSIVGTPLDMLRALQGGAKQKVPGTAQNPTLAFDEALSYLTEALLNPKGSDPALTSIAGALGQGLR